MNIVILGASSAIARAIAAEVGKDDQVMLLGRDLDDIGDTAADVHLQTGAKTFHQECDIGDATQRQQSIDYSIQSLGHIDVLFFCHGMMCEQEQALRDSDACARMLEINYTATVLFANAVLAHFEERKSGIFCFLSSVAGDRGRQSNFLYGSSKAALDTYVRGLQHKLAPTNLHALLVKPGFVDTAMTWGLPGMFLVASPERVARDIWRAIRKRRYTLYTPWFWRFIMLIIRCLPRFIFHKSKL